MSKFVNANNATAILGFNKYKSCFQVWQELKGNIEVPKFEEDEGISSYVKQALKDFCRDKLDISTSPVYTYKEDIFCSFAYKQGEECLVDYQVIDQFQKKNWLLESGEIKPPDYCLVKNSFNMAIHNLPAKIVILFGTDDLQILELDRNSEFETFILDKCRSLYSMDKPPAVDASEATTRTLLKLYPVNENGMVSGTKQTKFWAEKYDSFRSKEKKAETKKNYYGNKLRDFIGDREGIVLPDKAGKVTWLKSKDSKVFDEKKWKTNHLDWVEGEYVQNKIGSRTLKVNYSAEKSSSEHLHVKFLGRRRGISI